MKTSQTYYRATIAVASVLALAASAGCGTAGNGSGSSDSVKVGLVEPFSGSVSYYGQYAQQAWKLAESKFGSSPGGHAIAFGKFDGACTPAKAQSAVRQASADQSIVLIEGPGCSGPLEATQGILNSAKIPHLEGAFGTSVTNSGDKYVFRVQTRNAELTKALVQYMKSNGVSSAAVVNDTSGYSTDVAKTFNDAAKSSGIAVAEHITFTGGASDFSGQIAKLKSQNVHNVVLGCYDTDCGHFVKQASDLGLNATIWGVVTLQTVDFTNAIGANFKNIVDGGKVIFATDFIPTLNKPTIQSFVSDWKSRFKMTPTTDIANFYAVSMVVAQALKDIDGAVTRENLVTALRKAHVKGTPLGDVSFTSNGDLKCPPVFIGQWSRGEPTVVQNDSPACSGLS